VDGNANGKTNEVEVPRQDIFWLQGKKKGCGEQLAALSFRIKRVDWLAHGRSVIEQKEK